MWRAIVLAVAAYTAFQAFSPAQVSAVGSKGEWTTGLAVAYADFNEDCIIDVLDQQAIAFRYGASWPMPLYDNYYDIVPQAQDYDWPPPGSTGDDWTINIWDLQFVWGRAGMTCARFWDPELMGEYSYKSDTPTGPGTDCGMPVTDPPSPSSYAVDPIGVVFYGNATAFRLEQEAGEHDYPQLEDDPEQRFWEVGRCTFEDVDARVDREWTCTLDTCESWHFRAEVIDQESRHNWGNEHVVWGRYAVATPHFDDDCWPGEHFVPEVFPYPDEIYPGFEGSGFTAGVYDLVQRFVTSHEFADTEYWGNVTPVQQSCVDNEWPQGNGTVYFIRIP